MKIIQPSRLDFWRFVFALSAVLPFLSVTQILGSANSLGVDLSASKSWMGLVVFLSLAGLLSLLLFAATWSPYREQILSLAEFPERVSTNLHWISILVLTLALVGFTIVFMLPFAQKFFGGLGWMRFLIFWTSV